MLNYIRQHAQSWGVKIIFGVIILVFVFWGIGNYDSVSPGSVGTVNGKNISVDDFNTAYQAQLDQYRMYFPNVDEKQLIAEGVKHSIFNTLAIETLLDDEAEKLGLSASPIELYNYLKVRPEFFDEKNKFSYEVYKERLKTAGQLAGIYEKKLGSFLTRQKLRNYITMAASVTPEEAQRKYAFQAEKRTVSYVPFDYKDFLKDVEITDEKAEEFYKAKVENYTQEAQTSVRFLELTPKTLASNLEVSAEEIQAAYAEGPREYQLTIRDFMFEKSATPEKINEIIEKVAQISKTVTPSTSFTELGAKMEKLFPESGNASTEWVPRRQLPDLFYDTVKSLKKNQTAAPIKLEQGYLLLKLEQTNPDWSLSKAAIEENLKAYTQEGKAAMQFNEFQNKAEDMVAMDTPIEEIAKEFSLAIQETKLVARQSLPMILDTKNKDHSIFDAESGITISSLLESRDGVYIVQIKEQKEAFAIPFEDVKSEIKHLLSIEKAKALAGENADKVAANIKDGLPNELNSKVKISPAFMRNQDDIPEIGKSSILLADIFTSSIGSWLPKAYTTPQGAVLVKPESIIPLRMGEWGLVKEQIISELLSIKQNDIYEGFIEEIRLGADIRLADPTALDK